LPARGRQTAPSPPGDRSAVRPAPKISYWRLWTLKQPDVSGYGDAIRLTCKCIFKGGEQGADLGIHHLVPDIRVHGQQLDDLPDQLGLLLFGLIAGGLELPEQAADLFVVGLEHDDRIR
jgi:hypothetical protein